MNKVYTTMFLISIVSSLITTGCKPKLTSQNEVSEVSVGETFQISVAENTSTGYEMCWINKKTAVAISLVEKDHKSEGASDCAGCGGTATFTFKGIASGTDTIQLVNCPGPRNGETCDECSDEDLDIQKFIAVIK